MVCATCNSFTRQVTPVWWIYMAHILLCLSIFPKSNHSSPYDDDVVPGIPGHFPVLGICCVCFCLCLYVVVLNVKSDIHCLFRYSKPSFPLCGMTHFGVIRRCLRQLSLYEFNKNTIYSACDGLVRSLIETLTGSEKRNTQRSRFLRGVPKSRAPSIDRFPRGHTTMRSPSSPEPQVALLEAPSISSPSSSSCISGIPG